MKILTILLILLQINTFNYGNHSSTNGNNRYSGGNVPFEQTYRGIGYSTNYANGQFNSGVYKSSMTTFEYQNRTFTGTYNPASGSSGGSRPVGQTRRVKGYVEDGEGGYKYDGDDSEEKQEYWSWIIVHHEWNFWDKEEGYDYYWDGTSWWRKPKESDDGWQKWGQTNHWFQGCYEWITDGSPSGNYHQGYHENPTPIGDAIVPLLSLLLFYIGYDVFKRENS